LSFTSAPDSNCPQGLAAIVAHDFVRGTNVWVTAALCSVRANDFAVSHGRALAASAFIDNWSVYGPDGVIHAAANPNPHNPLMNAALIPNCANVTFRVFAAGGYAQALITFFSR
jgi:hypothetical protein